MGKKNKKNKIENTFNEQEETIVNRDLIIEDNNLTENMINNKKKNKKKNKNKKNDFLEEESKIEKTLDGFSYIFENNSISSDYRNFNIKNFSISTTKKNLFDNASLNIVYGNNYGFVAPNGKGKSTIMNFISKKIFPICDELDILLVEQEIKPSDKLIIDEVLDANEKRSKLIDKINNIEFEIEENNDYDLKLVDELNNLREELEIIGLEKDKVKVIKILNGLGFSNNDYYKKVKEFSGGWRMRIAIAKALYLEPTLLLLDEPTNHLDLNAVIWLTSYLENWKNSLIVVSHNQYFLNDICDEIIHIDNNKIYQYKGNYYKFVDINNQKRKNHEKEWTKIDKKIKEMKSKNTPKKEIQEYISKLEIKRPEKDYLVNINFGENSKIQGSLVTIDDVYFGYNNDYILEKINFGLDQESRITIVGANGSGKSTFINLLVGNLQPNSGYIYVKHGIKIGYYNQHFIDVLPMELTCIEYLQTIKDLEEQDIRKYLGTIGLEASAHLKKIGELSGGQKARVVLVSLQMQEPQILIMDEPTNHLDIESINGLIEGINNFEGCVVLVSHDMELITQTECVLWECKNKSISKFRGDYDLYKKIILDSLEN